MKKLTRGLATAIVTMALAVPATLAGTASADQRTSGTTPAGRHASFAPPAPGARPADSAKDTKSVQLTLPRPTGRLAVGRDTLHLVDKHRKDPWVPTADRELMVSLYYPAKSGTGDPTTYMTAPEAKALLAATGEFSKLVTAQQLSATRTNAREDARPLRSGGPYPLVVLSPGYTMQRSTLTVLAEELASRGYVVAAVDHAYESGGSSFPGGRLLDCVSCGQTGSVQGMRRVSDGRAKDVSFLLDQLTGPKATKRLSSLIDRKRIGMAGHSIGGSGTAATMAADARVRAGVNMDGTFFSPIPDTGLSGRPFLMLGGDPALLPPDFEDTSWEDTWQRLDGWKRWLTVSKAGHFSFTDWPVLADQVDYQDPGAPLSGTRSQQITRSYVGAFFAQHLRGVPQPLFDGPSPANPEVVFHQGG
ncbi:alpha/beta hydrolase family protein [Streptomyces zagrosensis]|uniref:Putative dienelactone hydrolase n=1 Tax=Streptomyces zagrosensis TaxID=1042984 RepID=A0A7W9Q9F1_9ACTN|nr:alpha/beta hydrolase [Streptomyces zagrosensis]MBB5935799.1 putative dienelactone hydrolase [Streptomyces zagrosensis]